MKRKTLQVEQVVLGHWLAWADQDGWPIEYLKIDASGFDVDAFETSGKYMYRILRVELRVWADECARPWKGMLLCTQVVQKMATFGYRPAYGQQCKDFVSQCGNR